MEGVPTGGARDFKARPSRGMQPYFVWAVVLMIPALVLWLLSGFMPTFVPLLVTGIMLIIAVVLLVAGYFGEKTSAGVHYEVSDRDLTLIGGSVRYTIPVSSIKRAYTRDIDLGVGNRAKRGVTGVRMPNLALGPAKYNDIGPLKMCATSPSERITIIETESGNYGVTPADEEGFKAAIGAKG